MNNKSKTSITVAGVIALLGAGGIYYRLDQLQQKADYFQTKFNKTKNSLPKVLSIDKNSQSGLFSTDIKYVVSIIKDGKKSDSKLVINTHLHHGIGYLFSGVIEGTAKGKIEGPFLKEFKSVDSLFDSNIQVLPDNTLITDTKFSDLVAKDGTQFKGISSFIKLTKDDDNLETNFKIDRLSSAITPQGQVMFNLKNFELTYKGKSEKIANNHFGLKIGEIASSMAQVKNINMSADSFVKGGSIDFKTSLSVAHINTSQWKNASIDFKYSLLGVDQAAFTKIYALGQQTAPKNELLLRKSIIAMEEQFKKIFTRGFSFNVDKLSFKSSSDNFDLSFKSSLPKSSTFEDVSFEKNLTLNCNVITKGNLSHIIATDINKKLQFMQSTTENPEKLQTEEQINVVNDLLHLNFDVNSGIAKLNGNNLPSDPQDVVHIVLSTIDEKLHAKSDNSEAVPAFNSSQAVEIK